MQLCYLRLRSILLFWWGGIFDLSRRDIFRLFLLQLLAVLRFCLRIPLRFAISTSFAAVSWLHFIRTTWSLCIFSFIFGTLRFILWTLLRMIFLNFLILQRLFLRLLNLIINRTTFCFPLGGLLISQIFHSPLASHVLKAHFGAFFWFVVHVWLVVHGRHIRVFTVYVVHFHGVEVTVVRIMNAVFWPRVCVVQVRIWIVSPGWSWGLLVVSGSVNLFNAAADLGFDGGVSYL